MDNWLLQRASGAGEQVIQAAATSTTVAAGLLAAAHCQRTQTALAARHCAPSSTTTALHSRKWVSRGGHYRPASWTMLHG
jgi:hypothetical protein